MKLFSLTLGIIILLLSCIPCSDGDSIASNQSVPYSTVITEAHKQAAGHGPHDVCSPFCQCSCCAVACNVVSTPFLKVNDKNSFNEKIFPDYQQENLLSSANQVWQPPKITANS